MSDELTTDQKLAALEARRDARFAEVEEERKIQYLQDQEAFMDLEATEGFGTLVKVKPHHFVSSLPTFAVVRTPKPVEYKRYLTTVGRAQEKADMALRRKAQDDLATVCWIYPSEAAGGQNEKRKAMMEAYPGLLVSIAIEAAKLAEGHAAAEGKG